MTLTHYNPFSNLSEFPTGLRLFEDTLTHLFSEPGGARPWAPPVDILETENELVLKADLPDVDVNDIDLRLENGTLTLKGERKFEKEDNSRGYHRIERGSGSFIRRFRLPETVDTDKVRADYKSGVLKVSLPKKDVARPKAVKVEVADK